MAKSASPEIQAYASINNEDENTQEEANTSCGNKKKKDLIIEIKKMFETREIQSSTQEEANTSVGNKKKKYLIIEIEKMFETREIQSSTQEEANTSGGNKKKKDLIIEIEKMFETREIQSSTQCRIHRVPINLRKWKTEAYSPQIISIGPFHHDTGTLKHMKEHKERYFRSFVQRTHINLENLVSKMRDLEESIRGCYAETIYPLDSNAFVKMIMVDASFILELFIRYNLKRWTRDDPMFVEPRATAMRLDLLLLENQLPFFVLEELYHLASSSCPTEFPLLPELTFNYFECYNKQSIKVHSNPKIQHFTDLLRTFHLRPLETELPERVNPSNKHLYSITQLREAGVKFAINQSKSFLDIKFEKGELKIPFIEINHSTEAITRNIMALEQTCYKENGYITDYFYLLDLLINTTKDVNLLCDKKIMVNYLGDNNAARSMVNDLNNGIVSEKVRADYNVLCTDLNAFYEKPWHKRMSTLRRQYFSNPWKMASTIAAIILLVLTFIQTVCSVIQVV